MAIVKKYKSVVTNVQKKLPDIYTVAFRSLEKQYKHKPGQFLHLALDEYNPSIPWPESRCFSMQSSPSEDEIIITFAVKGNFTNRMSRELLPGKEVYLKLPYGDLFSSPQTRTKSVFIAGGTGITPFLSLFTDESFAEYSEPRLYFGIRTEKHNIYNLELERAKSKNTGFAISIINELHDGKLNIHTICEDNGNDSIYYISGPPIMIKLFKTSLINAGVSQYNVKTDDWE